MAGPWEQYTPSAGEAEPWTKYQPEPAKPAGAMRKLGDVGLGFVQGAAGGAKALTDAAGAGNRASRALGAISSGAGKLMSQDAQDEIAALADDAKEQADKQEDR